MVSITNRRDAQSFFCVFPFRNRLTRFIGRVYPMVHMPHVSIDSPRRGKALPAQVDAVFTLYDDDQEYPVTPRPFDLAYIEAAVLREWSYEQVASRLMVRRVVA